MPAPFPAHERDRINDAMIAEARALIPVLGLRKLPIETLTTKAGISKGAFYAFFDSKEALYAEILAREGPGIAERVLSPLNDPSLCAHDAFATFLRRLMAEYETNPVFKRLIEHPDELAAVQRRLGPEHIAAKTELGFKPLLAFLTNARESGDLAHNDVGAVLGTVVALTHLILHKSAPGMGDWPATRDLMIDLIARGLFPAARSHKPKDGR